MNTDQKVHFAITGTGTIAAVGNGDGQTQDSYSGDTFNLFFGRALVVVRSARSKGEIKLTANAKGLGTSLIEIESRPANSQPELH
jgi:beta-galactosidase